MVRLQAAEADAWVRLFILESARRAPEREALVLLRGGVVDPEARVRAAAVRAIPAVPTAAAAMPREVLAALGDPSAEVRAGAARSAGRARRAGGHADCCPWHELPPSTERRHRPRRAASGRDSARGASLNLCPAYTSSA
jgi:hypothetical protein